MKFEAITCQWQGTKLSIFATRKLSSGKSITYSKGTLAMPKLIKHMAEFAKLLLAVLSLRRVVLMNYDKLNLVLEAKQRNELEMLQFEDDHDEINLRSDSTTMTNFGDEYEELEDEVPIIDKHLIDSLLHDIDNQKYDSDVKSYDDWEEFFIEKIQRRASTK